MRSGKNDELGFGNTDSTCGGLAGIIPDATCGTFKLIEWAELRVINSEVICIQLISLSKLFYSEKRPKEVSTCTLLKIPKRKAKRNSPKGELHIQGRNKRELNSQQAS